MSARRRRRIGVLWCSNARAGRSNRWAFPPAVGRHLRKLTAGKSVLQLFGGHATWGIRIDIDPSVRPHVIADAWLPPFAKNSFDVVILDPPYVRADEAMQTHLLKAAAYIARERVIWFHTCWISSRAYTHLEKAWLVRVGDNCVVRALQVFKVPRKKTAPRLFFTRGPAIKYNRWLAGQTGLPFDRKVS